MRGNLWRICLLLALLIFDGGLLFWRFRPGPPPPPAWLQAEAGDAWSDLLSRTGVSPAPPPPIRVYIDRAEFQAALSRAGGMVPASEAAGFWDGQSVHLDISEGEGVVRTVLRHELAHALIDPGRPPRWFDEGFAQWIMNGASAGPYGMERLATVYAAGADALAALERSDGRLHSSEIDAAYEAAEAAVRAMVVRWNAERMWVLAGDLARGTPFDEALLRRYGLGREAPAAVF